MTGKAFSVGDWCWFTRQASPCRVIERQDLKEFRLEALRAGFRAAWANKDYETIINIAKKVPDEALQEDEKLLTLYDLALTRTEEA